MLLISTPEGASETQLGLELYVELHRELLEDLTNLPNKWILDCQAGGREALFDIPDGVDELRGTEFTVATCFFHVVAALQLHKSDVPDFDRFIHEFYMIAEAAPQFFNAVQDAVISEWRARSPGWKEFVDSYFIPIYVVRHTGWNLGYLGLGNTRVNLEGMWPSTHKLLGPKKLHPIQLILSIIENVLPYQMDGRTSFSSGRNALTLSDRRAAVELSMASGDILKARVADGEQFFFCRKRILQGGRPMITEAEVDRYVQLTALLTSNAVHARANCTASFPLSLH